MSGPADGGGFVPAPKKRAFQFMKKSPQMLLQDRTEVFMWKKKERVMCFFWMAVQNGAPTSPV